MENPFFHLSLEELESGYLRWRSKRQLFWSGIAARPALKNGATKLPWITTRVLSGPTHRFKRRRKPQCTDGVEHSPETHPGWLTDEGTHSLDDNSEDSEVPKTGRLEAARGQPLSLHVGPTVLMLSHGYRFLAAFAETLAATAAQCMVSHPLHLAYMEHAKDARDRLAHIPRERGEGFEEVRGIRVERPARRTHHVTGQRVRLRCFRPCTPDERLELYRRVYGVDCQIPSGDRPPAGPKPPSRSHTPRTATRSAPSYRYPARTFCTPEIISPWGSISAAVARLSAPSPVKPRRPHCGSIAYPALEGRRTNPTRLAYPSKR